MTTAPKKHPQRRHETIRLKTELSDYIREEARKNTRTYSGEIAHRLEASRRLDQQFSVTKP